MEDLKTILTHTRDTWLPRTLNPMRDEETFILEIIDSLGSSLSLLCYAFSLEKKLSPDA